MENIIFTDGSSRGNPGYGGWGAVVIHSSKNVSEIGGREEHTTNNRMELTSVIEALSIVDVGSKNVVYTDSSYLIKGITKWIKGWKKNGWVTKTKEEVLNRDLWEKLDHLVQDRMVKFKYIGGHIGIVGNERCDVIATGFADNKKVELYEGPIDNYPIKDILDISVDEMKLEEKNYKNSNKNAKAYSYVSKVDGVIQIHKSWAECEKRVKGAKKALYKKALSKENEDSIIRDFSNR